MTTEEMLDAIPYNKNHPKFYESLEQTLEQYADQRMTIEEIRELVKVLNKTVKFLDEGKLNWNLCSDIEQQIKKLNSKI